MTAPTDNAELVERLNGADPDHVTPINALQLFDHDSATFTFSPEDAEGVLDLIAEAASAIQSLSAQLADLVHKGKEDVALILSTAEAIASATARADHAQARAAAAEALAATLQSRLDRAVEGLSQCVDAIASLPEDALGFGGNGEGMAWPFRDELLSFSRSIIKEIEHE